MLVFTDGLGGIILDRTAAYRLWAPTLTADPFTPANETSKYT